MRRVDGALVSEDCGAVGLLQHPLRSPSPPATATQKHSPISPRCEKESGTPQLEIREQFIASYGLGLVCLLHTLTHKHTTFLSFREHINTRVSSFSSVQEIWSEQVSACKLKCGAPRSPPVLHYMIDSPFSFFLSSAPPPFFFVSLQIFGATIMGFGLWILLDNQSLIAVLRKFLHKMCATNHKMSCS